MIQVTIGTVDMYGLCGRDLHPEKDDSGRTAKLVKSEIIDLAEGVDVQPGEEDDFPKMTFLTVKFEDGRQVELAEYEVAKLEVVL